MRKRLALLVMSLTVVALLVPATPAAASSCVLLEDPVDGVLCLVFIEPVVRELCEDSKFF